MIRSDSSSMRHQVSKAFSCVAGHPLCLWLLGFAVAVFFLGAWSRLSLLDGYSGPIDEHLIPTKVPSKGTGYPPILAYCIFGSKGDSERILRLLKSIYHPRNQYLLYLDASSSNNEKIDLVFSVQSQKEFRAFGNVHVVGRSYAVNEMGASSLAAVLHGAALLLRMNADWDWFTTLSPSDYPLLTQDDILYALSALPRNLNFVHYTNKKDTKDNEIVVDPGLYLIKNSPIFPTNGTREEPNAFKIYRGSPWMMLSRSFTEHCVKGLDNFPRKLLMYFTNVVYPMESYFHTVLCNTPKFQNTTVNIDLRYILASTRNLKGKPRNYEEMVASPAFFARSFKEGDPLLEEIDRNILNCSPGGVVPGNWCIKRGTRKGTGGGKGDSNYCSIWDDIDSIKPGNYGMLLSKVLAVAATGKRLVADQCQSFA